MIQNNSAPARLLSLDVFRGVTVAAMILVNNPGDWGNIYSPLRHAEWHGCTPTDLIFPFFLFIVGVSIVFSLSAKKAKGVADEIITRSIIKRATILFILGVILALVPDVFVEPVKTISTVRIPGVLQRIAIVFLCSGLLFYKASVRVQGITFGIILILHWILMTIIPIPGGLEPNLDKETNLGAWLDRTILTENHLWKLSKTWDPEGILSTLPSVASGISGILAGIWLKRNSISDSRKVIYLTLLGFISMIAGLGWHLFFPLNKALWTSSYVLYTSGLAAIVLGALYWIIDIKNIKGFTMPFVVYGVNAITVYFMSTIMAKLFNFIKVTEAEDKELSLKSHLFSSYFSPNLSPLNASLAWALCFVLFWLIILWIMFKRNVIIKV